MTEKRFNELLKTAEDAIRTAVTSKFQKQRIASVTIFSTDKYGDEHCFCTTEQGKFLDLDHTCHAYLWGYVDLDGKVKIHTTILSQGVNP
jgi:hypothetical protein